MSLVQILFQKLAGNPLRLSLVTGVISSSYFTYGNLGTAYFGIVPAIQDAHGTDLSVATKVELWKWYYDRAKIHMVGSTITSTVSFSVAAYFTSSPQLRYLLLSATGLAFAVMPFTILTMFPVNNELIAMQNAQTLDASSKIPSPEHALLEKRALERLKRWTKLHRVRMVLGMATWMAGFTALIASV